MKTMKRIFFLLVGLILVCGEMLLCSAPEASGADHNAVRKYLDDALKARLAGNVEVAIKHIQSGIEMMDVAASTQKEYYLFFLSRAGAIPGRRDSIPVERH